MYARDVDGRVLTFSATGQLWKGSMVMNDEETWTHWSHTTGEAESGPLKGKRLRLIPSVITDWQSWRQQYPDGSVGLGGRLGHRFGRDFYRNPEQFVLGIAAGEQARAWPLALLTRTPVRNETWQAKPIVVVFDPHSTAARVYERTVGERVLTFRPEEDRLVDAETGSRWAVLTGRAVAGPLAGQALTLLPALISERHVWVEFHPQTEMVQP